MTRHEGTQQLNGQRMEKELRVYALLESLDIPFQRIDHEAAMTMEACAAIEGSLGAAICKNLLLCNRQGTQFYLLLMPGAKPFKTKLLSAQLGCARLSFAAGGQMEALLDITPGSLSILGLMNDRENRVRLLIDEDLLREEFFGCHPCINTSTLRLRTEDVTGRLIPAMGHVPTVVTLPWEVE